MSRFLEEYNLIRKDHRKVDLKIALCYPSTYAVGMSSLGFRLIYALMNSKDNVACERVFYVPGRKPRSIESGLELHDFDIIGFSLQYEEDYINLVRMLIDSGIKLRREERKNEEPLIVVGGICAIENPRPLSDFVDVFVIGDGEVLVEKLVNLCIEERGKEERIETLSGMDGFYTPAIEEGKVRRVWCKSIENTFYPIRQVVPASEGGDLTPVFGRSFLLEVVRGCERGCRFCLIGFCGRPKRARKEKVLIQLMEEGVRQSGVKKVTLIAPSLSEHNISNLCWEAVNAGLEVSLPSLSIDAITDDLLDAIMAGGQRTITIAPEAGTEELRTRINKPFLDDEIVSIASKIIERNFSLKMYFMVGLPYEEDEDIKGIATLINKIASKRKTLKISLNPFIPKPHTPFAWAPLNMLSTFKRKIKIIQRLLKGKKVIIEGLDPRKAIIEAFLSLGGSEVGKIIELAAQYGGGLGGWRRAFKEANVDLNYLYDVRDPDNEQPWEVVDVGVSKQFLINEWVKAHEGVKTPPYSECKQCMICNY